MSEYTDIDRKKDFDFFLQHYQELYQEYGHKLMAIKNTEILGIYDSVREAIYEIGKTYPLGTFIVQECNGDESGYTHYMF